MTARMLNTNRPDDAAPLAAIATSLASIDESLKDIAAALCSAVPWNVSVR